MKTASLPAIVAVLAAAGCAGSSGPSTASPAGMFNFVMPSPPTASYVMADTIVMDISGSPTGDMTMTMLMHGGMDLEFASDPEGIRVTGAMTIDDATMSSPALGTMPLPYGDFGEQTMELLISPGGEIEIISAPDMAGLGGMDFGAGSDPTAGLFPDWPEGGLEPGDSWTDTVEASPDMDLAEVGASMESTSTTITTYTFVGDTVVDGRTLLHFVYEGESFTEMVMGVAGAEMNTTMAGTTAGLFLWDADRGLVSYLLTTMDMSGDMAMPGLGNVAMAGVVSHHMTLEN